VLIHGIGDLYQPRFVFSHFEQFSRSKELDAIRRRITQWLEQTRRHENRHIMRLAVEHPTGLFRRQTRRYPERFAQEALGHNSKAVHRAYAKRALMKLPSLEQNEQAAAKVELGT
jgi:hypothetical protein